MPGFSTARFGRIAAAALAVTLGATVAASAADKIRVGKAVATSFALAIADVGNDYDIWKKVGLEVEVIAFKGDAQLQQALTAGTVDFGLGSGPGLGYAAKGVPATGVAAFAGPPYSMAILVPPDSTDKGAADLKGDKIGVTTAGSLTDWLVRELSRQQGWGPTGIQPVPMGAMRTRLAAMKTGQIQGTVQEISNGYELEEEKEAKILVNFGDIVPKFITHVVFARNEIIKDKPELVKTFLKGFFMTIKYMKEHKPETVKSIAKILQMRESVVDKTYGPTMEMLSDDGHWDPEALKTIQRSLPQLGILPTEPDMSKLYDPRFVPVKLDSAS
jgi:ABC-type nitrate/sulfonate/bicarbonate transport system substrate-binding protein